MSELEQCMRSLEIIGNGLVQKSATYQTPKVARARAIAKASSTPEGAVLARRIMQLHRQEVVRKSLGMDSQDPIQKLESLQAEKLQIIRSLNAGNQDHDGIKRLQEIYDDEGDIVKSLINAVD
ncbi:MAG: hypothetical protein WC455_21505 [Dehalococcoidia bacterium]|jgi:hypothetical protein